MQYTAKGGYTRIRHNEIRDTFANLMMSKFQLLQGESFNNNSQFNYNWKWGTTWHSGNSDMKISNPNAKKERKLHKDE